MSLPLLPTLTVPTYEVKLYSRSTPTTFRPYLVKEEKILLMAQQSGDEAEIERAVKQIITNCTNGTVDVEKLPSFDIEYLFLQLRAKSVNNVIPLRYQCKAPHGNGICGFVTTTNLDLDEVKLTVDPAHTNKIMLNDKVGVTLRYPTAKNYGTFNAESVDISTALVECLETIFTVDGEVHECSEQTKEDLTNFVEGLSLAHIEKIQAFFETLPRLTHTFTFKCERCGYTEDITLSGLSDFFE